MVVLFRADGRGTVETALQERGDATRHGAATIAGFVAAGVIPLVAYLLPIDDDARFALAIGLTALALFGVGASRALVTGRGYLRSGGEMLLVGSLAAVVAYAIGALAAGLAGE
jgi:VIT1/CCC1 family predicted Fe2+/Mn2+ transporter